MFTYAEIDLATGGSEGINRKAAVRITNPVSYSLWQNGLRFLTAPIDQWKLTAYRNLTDKKRNPCPLFPALEKDKTSWS